MRQIHPTRPGLVGLLAATALGLLAACGDDGADTSTSGPLLNGGGSGTGVLKLACPGSVTAGVKTVNGFSASLIQANGTPVANTFVGISPTPNQGDVFAPAESSTATFGGNTDANGLLTFGFTPPESAALNSAYSLVAKAGSQTTSCRVTVQAASLSFTAPSAATVYNTCTPVRLRLSSTANGDPGTKVGGSVDLTADNGGLFTSSANSTSCTGQATLTGVGVSGATGDFQNPLYVLSPSVGATTVTATDAATPSRSASVTVQFTTTVTQVVVTNSPSQVSTTTAASTNGGSPPTQSTLSAMLYDARGRLVAGKPVTFTLTTPVSSNTSGNRDQVFPPVSTTNANGVATATYAAGSTLDNGGASANAVITVCAQDTNVCTTRTITVNR